MVRHWRDVEPGDPEYADLVGGLVLVWGFCDTVSSLTAARFVGVGGELNPLIRALLPDLGELLAVKFAAVLVAALLMVLGERFVRTAPWWRAWLAGLVGVGVGVTTVNLLAAYAPLLG